MAVITQGDLVWDVAAVDGIYPEALDADQKLLAKNAAIEWLWALSGRQFGYVPAVYRPQARILNGCYDTPSYLQSIWGPIPYNPQRSALAAKQVCELLGPVVPPTHDAPVLIAIYPADGGPVVNMSSADVTPLFRVEGSFIVRQDGGIWPETQNLVAKIGDANTWQIGYKRGVIVPPFGQYATALLIQQFAKRLVNDKDCKIPYNAVTVTRAGITINRNAVGGKMTTTTGVPEADQWVAEVNPNGIMQQPQVWSPDISRNAEPYAGSYVPSS